MSYLLRGILIGLLFGLPVGAVGTMTVQRTLAGGKKAGLLTGLGSSVADCIYACIGVCGLTIISDLLLRFQTAIHLVGGGFIMLMGLRVFLKKGNAPEQPQTVGNRAGLFLTSFLIGITNPAAILTFLFAFSYFGIPADAGLLPGAALVWGVFLGTYFWWGILTMITDLIRKRSGKTDFQRANKLFGTLLVLFALIIFIQTF